MGLRHQHGKFRCIKLTFEQSPGQRPLGGMSSQVSSKRQIPTTIISYLLRRSAQGTWVSSMECRFHRQAHLSHEFYQTVAKEYPCFYKLMASQCERSHQSLPRRFATGSLIHSLVRNLLVWYHQGLSHKPWDLMTWEICIPWAIVWVGKNQSLASVGQKKSKVRAVWCVQYEKKIAGDRLCNCRLSQYEFSALLTGD